MGFPSQVWCPCLAFKVAAGTDMIFKLNASLVPAGIDRVAWIDGHGYDCWPAISCLEAPLLDIDVIIDV